MPRTARLRPDVLAEARVTCPWCWQTNHLTVDCSAGDAELVEDCTVCCRPMVLQTCIASDGDLAEVRVSRES